MLIKKSLMLFMTIMFLGSSFIFASDLLGLWSINAGGNGEYSGNATVIDHNDNIYVVGTFEGTTSIFGESLTSIGGKDIFVAKLDDNKNTIWIRSAGGTHDGDSINAITVDSGGNVYVAGSFTSEANIFGVDLVSTHFYDSDIFVAKLDSDGNTVWVKKNSGPKHDYAKKIKVDDDGYIYLLGEFETGVGADMFGITLISDGAALDIFLIKMDNLGNAIWAKKTGNDKQNYALDLELDGDNIYVAGVFQSSTSIFGGISLNTTQWRDSDVFVAKLDSTGNVIWAKKGGNTEGETVNSINIDENNVYIVGTFNGSNNNMFGVSMTSSGNTDGYLIKLNSDGNNVLDRQIGGVNNNSAVSTIIDAENNIYIIGNFEGNMDSLGESVTATGGSDIYIAKLDSNGSLLWIDTVGGTGDDSANYICLNNNDNVYMIGKFQGDSNIFGTTLYPTSSTDLFISKLLPLSAVVIIPDTTDISTVEAEFISKGYTKNSNHLLGSRAISLKNINGNIRTELVIKNEEITLTIPANTQFKKSDNTTNYDGIITAPIIKVVNNINGETPTTSFSVGSNTESLKLVGGEAELMLPVATANIGDNVTVYYSEDSGETWSLHDTISVTDIGGEPYVEFTTSHFTDFAVVLGGGGSFEGSFVIDNDAASTTSQSVTLNMTTSPPATNMRFSNDGLIRSSREVYAITKSWTLTAGYETKIVYVQFDEGGDEVSDAQVDDSIEYIEASSDGTSHIIVTISKSESSCSSYFGDYDYGIQTASYSVINLTGSNVENLSCVWVSDNHSINVATSTVNLEGVATSYNIPFTNLELLATTFTANNNSACNWSSTAYDTPWVPSTVSHVYLTKIADGKTCDYTLDSPDLTLDIPANQAIDTYTGKVVFTIVE